MNFLKLFLSLCLLHGAFLHAEIQKVTILWTKYLCDQGCANLLENQFRRIPGVADVTINQPAAQATLQWKPNVPFSYTDIDTAMRMVGPAYDDLGIRLRVRGTIRHDQNSVTLISMGDNTNFYLLSPITPSTTQYVEMQDIKSHTLWPDVRAELLDAEAQNFPVEVEGPLFQPEQAPPYYIIIQQKKILQPQPEPKG